MARPCHLCADLQHGYEIENEQGDDADRFPESFSALVWRLSGLGSYGEDSLKQCPACLQYFYYRRWTPGGSDDAMRTYEHELIAPRSLPDVCAELEDAESSAVITAELEVLRARADEIVGEVMADLRVPDDPASSPDQMRSVRRALTLEVYLPWCTAARDTLAGRVEAVLDHSNQGVRRILARALGRPDDPVGSSPLPAEPSSVARYRLTNPRGPVVSSDQAGRSCPRCRLNPLRADDHFINQTECPSCGYVEWIAQ
jgi:hypothetical protein